MKKLMLAALCLIAFAALVMAQGALSKHKRMKAKAQQVNNQLSADQWDRIKDRLRCFPPKPPIYSGPNFINPNEVRSI